jgi:hypothetical protein
MLERRNIGLLEAGAVTLYLPLSVGAHKRFEFMPGRCRLNRAHALAILLFGMSRQAVDLGAQIANFISTPLCSVSRLY